MTLEDYMTECNRLRSEVARLESLVASPDKRAELDEKQRRIYYQDIVYAVCKQLDRIYGLDISKGTGVCCGTLESPSTEVQQYMHLLAEDYAKPDPQADSLVTQCKAEFQITGDDVGHRCIYRAGHAGPHRTHTGTEWENQQAAEERGVKS